MTFSSPHHLERRNDNNDGHKEIHCENPKPLKKYNKGMYSACGMYALCQVKRAEERADESEGDHDEGAQHDDPFEGRVTYISRSKVPDSGET